MSEAGPLRVGVGGPVGSGKTALVDRLCKHMRDAYDIAVITNDIYTKEDAEFLTRSGALPPERIVGVGAEVVGSSPEEFGAFLRSEFASWAKVIKEVGISVE